MTGRWWSGLGLAVVVIGCTPRLPGTSADLDVEVVLPAGARVELVDVALAWPLPAGTGAGDQGHLGPILTCDQLGTFEPLTRSDEPADLCAALTVTAARLDPCAPGDAEGACRSELRLVLQPVFAGAARDAAIHVFYAVDDDDLLRAIKRLMVLRLDAGLDGRGALGVHPLLVDEAGRRAVGAVIAAVIAAARLDHFTQITVHGDDDAWTFELRNFIDGEVTTGDARVQHVLSQSSTAIDISITPASGSDDSFVLLLDNDAAAAATIAEQQAAFDHAGRVEDPDVHNMGSIDCATCHVAAPARAATRARFAEAGLVLDETSTFRAPRHDLTASAVFRDPRFIHAFAWRDTDLAVNQRVVNEAARSADLVDAAFTEQGLLP